MQADAAGCMLHALHALWQKAMSWGLAWGTDTDCVTSSWAALLDANHETCCTQAGYCATMG